MKFGGMGAPAKIGRVGGMRMTPKISGAPKIHPAASFKTKVRLPDTGSIGADPAPSSSVAGKF
jgi:hypothetical protein